MPTEPYLSAYIINDLWSLYAPETRNSMRTKKIKLTAIKST